MDQPSGRSFMQVLCEKYSPENFPYRRGPGMGVHVPATPQGSPMKDRLNLPSVLVLNSCGITCAGDEKEIAAFCAHVSELDLSDNKLEDWHEVSKIVSNVPQLEFLNLSSNPLNLSVLERTCAGSFSGVRKLVLNNIKASWETVHTILQELPDLEELFLCLNDYETVSCPSICCHSLKLLHITDNNLQDWTEIRKLGVMFPSLDTLVLANNHLNAIEEPDDSLARLFPNLRSISLHKSGLQSWEDIDKLNSFPKLEEVRLLGIPLLQPYTTEERRKLVVARLPSVSKLNGSVVTDGEREDSERFFIRYYVDVPQEEVPFSTWHQIKVHLHSLACRHAVSQHHLLKRPFFPQYHELITKYGKLEPLAEVDLRPQSSAKVEVHFNDQVEEMSIRLDQTVAELKKQLKTLVQLPTSNMLLYYFDHEAPFGPEEMKYSSRALHSFGIRDGDKIYVESKTK
ncbi:tubulin-specific chaperone cofactor E-like protein isoform X1 [Lepus europaeus]|uniref:tubulin-specific chaperone cofactor E-like protein isoform X1 n=1 Tax=Lepus europaeus TaxID=9983 RepID=UPI002B4931F4|nr:tubulin-specific chaperone cofactor E-like protein isoform X1 [Lepus europaeus]XP_062053197.1 tubulin-specific chaperone cofactor E-like protein isoform X1 [Lepus europaeus]XP_062053198.1 tubulin-specific chaperone cofactor E-like protein isoform X1 [Lepus europaeus]XP_062053199.1 tubulin-specific chaperone cofactor E-like protein isoform X1 [Lepus europaeus]XP_062053201.1 tubulin-specific chaperone cofactor E-like protein isoform X1 [Lepus europaeus]XP_062053202.1 tubulin-specific chaperon